MTDPVPSKDEVWSDARIFDELGDYDPSLSRRDCEQIFKQALGMIHRLQTALRGIQSCSTCEACRGTATRALGGEAPKPQTVSAAHAFELGWRTAANWCGRDDLIADIGSPVYEQDKAKALGAAPEPPAALEIQNAIAWLRTIELACDARDDRQSVTYIGQVRAILHRLSRASQPPREGQ